ncbi:hypothetical protein PV328_003013 [Microctonus aethiopoides]|uniref:Uncharacterized protein n=1 Tax=Microctonus aethiopoides TaxID=144406 RepID=A0AA39F7H8_9HYME|nr:hypothetical protein PV328_003013 [Microctonus aethiopoides]
MHCDSYLMSTCLCTCNYDRSSMCPSISRIKSTKIHRSLIHKSTCCCNYNPFNDETKDNEIHDLGFALRKLAAMKCQMKKWRVERLQLESETRSLKKKLKKFDVNVDEPLEEDPLLIHYRDENIRLEKNKEQLEDRINELEELMNEQELFNSDSSAGIKLIREKMHSLRRDHKKLKKTIMEMKIKFVRNGDELSCADVKQLCEKIRELTNELGEKKISDKEQESVVNVNKPIDILMTRSKSCDDLQVEIERIKAENKNLHQTLETIKNNIDINSDDGEIHSKNIVKSDDDKVAMVKKEESSKQLVFDSMIDHESTLKGKLMKCNNLVEDLRRKLDEKDKAIQSLQKNMVDKIEKMETNDETLTTEVENHRIELKKCEEIVKKLLKQLEESSLDLESHDTVSEVGIMKESQLNKIKNERDKLLNEVKELREMNDKNSKINKILNEKDKALNDSEANNAVLRDKIDALLSPEGVLRNEIDQLSEETEIMQNHEEQNIELMSKISNFEMESRIDGDKIDSEHEILTSDLRISKEETEALRYENEMHSNEKKKLKKQLIDIQTENNNYRDELNKYKNENDKLNEMITKVKCELSDCDNEKEKLQLEISQLENSNEKWESGVENLTNSHEEIVDKIKISDESKNRESLELKTLRNELDQLIINLDNAQKDNNNLTNERDMLKNQIVEMQEELSKEIADKVDLKKAIDKPIFELNQYQLDNEALKIKNNQLQEDINHWRKKINKGKLEFDKLKEELKNTKKELESNNITLNKINDLNEELDALNNELIKCRNENNKLRNNLDESKQQKNQLINDVENFKSEIDELKSHCEKIKNENESLKDESERLRNEISNLKSDSINTKKFNENLTFEMDTLKSNLSKCHSERDKLTLELAKLEDEYNKNNNKFHERAKEFEELKEALDKSEHQAHSLELNFNALKDEKEILLTTLSSLREEVNTLKRNVIDKDNELKESEPVKHELIALKNELNKCREELNRSNRESDFVKKQIDTLKNESEITKDQLSVAIEKIDMEKKYKDIKNERDELKKQLEESKINIDELKAEISINNVSIEEMDALKNTLGKLRKDLKNCKMENDEFKSEINKWQNDSTISNTELDAVKEENLQFHSEVKSLKEEVDDLNHKVNEMKSQNIKLEKELMNRQGEMENKMMEHNKLKANNAKLKTDNDELLLKYDEMINEKKKFADNEVNNFEKEIKRLKVENYEIKNELQTVRNELNSSQRYNEGAMMIGGDKSRDEAIVSEEVKKSMDLVELLKRKNNELAINLEELKSDINKYENENRILKANVNNSENLEKALKELNKWQKIAENLQEKNDILDINLQVVMEELTKTKRDAEKMTGSNDNLNTGTLMESTQPRDVEQWQEKVKVLKAEIERMKKEHEISTRIGDGQSSMQQLFDELDKWKKTAEVLRKENNEMKSKFDKIQVDRNRSEPSRIDSRRPLQISNGRPDAPIQPNTSAMSNELIKALDVVRMKMEKQRKGVQRMHKSIDNMLRQTWSESSNYIDDSDDLIMLDTMNPIIAEVLELSNDLSTNIFHTEKELMNLSRVWKARWDENIKLQKLVESLGNAETIKAKELQEENVRRNVGSFDSESWLSSLTLTQLAELHDKICLLTTSLVREDCYITVCTDNRDDIVNTSNNHDQLQYSYDVLNRKIAALQRQIAEKQTEAEQKVLDMRQVLRREQAELIQISEAMNQEKKRNLKLRAELVIVYEDVIFPIINEKYFGMVDAYLTEDNRIAGNFSIIQSLPESAVCHIYMLGDSMGEYVVPSGLDAEMTLCEMINEPIVLGNLLKVFGFNKDECPPKAGFYGNEGYMVPTTNFPDSFTSNKYLFIIELYTSDEAIITVHLTLDVQL